MSNVSSQRTRVRIQPVLAALIAFFAVAAMAPAASAATPAKVTKLFGGPIAAGDNCNPDATATQTAATSRPDFCIAFNASNPDGPSGEDLKSQAIDTPRGFAGEADRYGQCTDAQFAANTSDDVTCPDSGAGNSQMGQTTANIVADAPVLGPTALPNVPGRVFNLTHSNNEVARLGIILDPFFIQAQPKVKIIVRVVLRPNPDVGLRSIIDNMPTKANLLVFGIPANNRELSVDQFNLRFWGSGHAGQTRPFGLLGSDCTTDQNTSLTALSYGGTASSAASKPYRLTNCAGAGAYTPSVAFSTSETRPDATTETNVFVRFAEAVGAKVAPTPKKTVVTLPDGLSFSGQIASGANGLPLCTPGQFGYTSGAPSVCPDATAVGSVSFKSPLLTNRLEGKAYLGPQPAPGALPDLFIEAQLGTAVDAPRVKLIGKLTLDERNRIVTTLDDLPQVPVSEFKLTFRGGDQAAVVTPPTCGTFTGDLAAYSYSAPASAVAASNTVTIPETQPDCEAVKAFTPSVGFGLSDPQAGGNGALTTTISRPDRTQRIGQIAINLPPGQLANLKGVPECSQALAAASSCPLQTRVGSVTAAAGVGPAPYNTGGDVYLTAREPGAAAGLSIAVPIRFGEVDLGNLAVPARVEIRPGDLGLVVKANVPERFAGVPLNIRSMSIKLDRAGFPLAPTSCLQLTTTSNLVSIGGTPAGAVSGFQATGCEKLPFEPEVSAAVTGKTGNKDRPDLSVRIRNAQGSGALRQVYVTLPNGIAVDLLQIPRACAVDLFQAGGCPDTAKIGKVSGSLSITDEPLAGDLYLLTIPGQTLPGLGLNFVGRFSGRVVGANKIDKTGQLISQFETLPDLPLTEFQLDIKGGQGGPLVSTSELCAKTVVAFKTRLVSHSGPARNRNVETTCGAPLSERGPKFKANLGGVRKGKPTLALSTTAPKGLRIRQVDLKFPKGWNYNKSRAHSTKSVVITKLSLKSTKAVRKATSSKRIQTTKLRLKFPKKGTTKFRVTTRTGTMTLKSKKARKSKKKIVVIATVKYTNGKTATVPIRLRPR